MPYQPTQPPLKALIIGISGPSSSGKTTLARLLQRIFCGVSLDGSSGAEIRAQTQTQTQGTQGDDGRGQKGKLNTFIIHEDDFYFPDDQIPYTTTPSGATIQDWDTASAIDIPFLTQALIYVQTHGRLPPRLQSKEDQNETSDSGVPDSVVMELRNLVQERIAALWNRRSGGTEDMATFAFLEGFLLYAPPGHWSTEELAELGHKGDAPMRSVHEQIDLPLFLPASYSNVKARREGRSGYVTLGPGPEPPANITSTGASTSARDTNTPTDKEGGDGKWKNGQKSKEEEIDLEKEDDRPPQNFWVDPPGYVDDIVWPRYVEEHAWLLMPQHGDGDEDGTGSGKGENLSLVERIGDGTAVRENAGVYVAPGRGEGGMEVVLRWAVGEILELVGCEEGPK